MRLLFIIFILSLQVFGQQSFNLDDFVNAINKQQDRVEEFRFIKETAKKLGIPNVYMFGGTAAAWGHYVRWDMLRQLGIEDLQPHRFDYDYTNIFRANQDFDVVINGTIEQAEALEAAVQSEFNYFSGNRPTWEVRLLNKSRGDKESILGSDFQNQHTDSHSTGLIEMTDCEGFDCIKDVRDMKNNRSAFLMDVYEAKLHYYYSPYHKTTNRFKAGMNPEILSVVRYFTKAVQYGLNQRPEDIKLLKEIINNFNPKEQSKWDSYVLRWLEKNAKKLIMNAIDMEFAQNLVEKVNLKKKLIALGDKSEADSMAWWLNKEALKSKPVGIGKGKTAAELFEVNGDGEIIVAHETNNFSAFESITKAHNGKANVLISRQDVNGEAAMYGDGHYTRIGREGAAGTGLTIRYKLDPKARDKTDFIHHDEYVVVLNKNILTVVYENMGFSALDYYKSILLELEFDESDKGILEKAKRRLLRKTNILSDEDLLEIKKLINHSLDEVLDQVVNSIKDRHDKTKKLGLIFQTLKELDLYDEFLQDNRSRLSEWLLNHVLKRIYVEEFATFYHHHNLLDHFVETHSQKVLNRYRHFINGATSELAQNNIFKALQKLNLLDQYFNQNEQEFIELTHKNKYEQSIPEIRKMSHHWSSKTKWIYGTDQGRIVQEWAKWKTRQFSVEEYFRDFKKISKNYKLDKYQQFAIEEVMVKKISKLSVEELKKAEAAAFKYLDAQQMNDIWMKAVVDSEMVQSTLVENVRRKKKITTTKDIIDKAKKGYINRYKLRQVGLCLLTGACAVGGVKLGLYLWDNPVEATNIFKALRNFSPWVLFLLSTISAPGIIKDLISSIRHIEGHVLVKADDKTSVKLLSKISANLKSASKEALMSYGDGNHESTFDLEGFDLIELKAKIVDDAFKLTLSPKKNIVFKIEDYEREVAKFYGFNSCNLEYLSF